MSIAAPYLIYYLGWLLRPSPPDEEYPPPELFSHTINSGEEVRKKIVDFFSKLSYLLKAIFFFSLAQKLNMVLIIDRYMI